MREIKFRAWDKLDKRMMYRGIFDKNWYATERNDEKGCHCIKGIVQEDRHTLELMQFTGLLDKSGKEIYEGDILSSSNNCKVEWNNRDCSWVSVDFTGMRYAMHNDGVYEIIGNIYSNPELLTAH